MVPSIGHIWYYTTLSLVNSEGNGNFSGTSLSLVFQKICEHSICHYRNPDYINIISYDTEISFPM